MKSCMANSCQEFTANSTRETDGSLSSCVWASA
eukprot:CAMPEP_0203847134 /NCGR_PEP_ID=MMETSP0359-20131031/4839_1 /ASSEMBLY_ACC=CAM_ASM_000338 /TAXON_ID=268821 /ORGANISM="Scrippsiella Hangoei, Strain SHTV-5" /LENGTH=32 /DNA_ID= /DNA_START= /DNA_END= /DNA_ORIENTATION=